MAGGAGPRHATSTTRANDESAPERGAAAAAVEARPTRVWLYFSGGGLRAALGSLGVVWFLDHPASGSIWRSVTRVSSVSGGSVENAALMTDPDIESHVRGAFRRFTGHGTLGRYGRAALTTAAWLAAAWAVARVAEQAGTVIGLLLWVMATGLVLAALQNLVTTYTGARLAGIATGPKRDPANHRLHLFAAADTRSGLPVYFASRYGADGSHRAVLAHDRRAERTGVEFYELAEPTPADLAFASSRWPMLHTPAGIKATRAAADATTADQAFWIVQPKELNGDRAAGRFNLLDGGLTGTLGTRLDPRLFGMEGTGVMGALGWSLDDGTDEPVTDSSGHPAPAVHRVVVDGARYMTTNRLYRVHRVPGVGGLIGIMRAIAVSLDSQITLDRDLVDDQPAVWYVPVTGHGRRQPLRYRGDVRLAVVGRGVDRNLGIRALDRLDIMKRAVNHEGVLLLDLDDLKDELAGDLEPADLGDDGYLAQAERTIELVERLRFMADATSYFRLLRQRGLACAASGVANAFIEANGMRGRHDELVALIDEFTVAVRQRGALDEVLLDPTADAAAVGYRWPELLDVHPSPAPTYWVSHRGDRTQTARRGRARGNTLAAFTAAYERGARVFECDVQAVKGEGGSDDTLVGLHTSFGWHIHGLRVPRAAWRMTRSQLERALADGDAVDTIAELLAAFPDVSWNLEAKRSRSMRALLRTLDELDRAGTLPERPIIVSGGMRRRTILLARNETARPLMTAATLGEKIRLFFGRRAPHVAVVQLPARGHWFTGRIARNAIAQRIHVQWFGVSSRGLAARLRARTPRCGLSTDDHDLIEITV